MKKSLIGFATVFVFISCNSNKNNNEKVGKDIDPYRQVGVENVNGNIPDTTNSINLSTKKVDSVNVHKDSSSEKKF